MRTIIRAFCGLALGSASAAYADFSWELAGFVGQSERGDRSESDTAVLSAAYYLDDVADGDGPPALAAFLDPTTNLFAAVSEDEATIDFGNGPVPETESSEYTIGGTYVFSRSKWYAGGRYSSGEFDEPQVPLSPPVPVASDSDNTRYALVAGKYLGTTRLELSVERSKLETEQSFTFCPIFPITCFLTSVSSETRLDTERLDVKHVGRIRSATYAVFGGISSGDAHLDTHLTITPLPPGPIAGGLPDLDLYSVDTYAIGAELYPIPSVGVRLGYTRADRSTFTPGPGLPDEDTLGVGVSWFFRRNVGFEVTLTSVDTELLPRGEGATLRVIGRL
mgnify:CR=1 FL=1